MNQEQDLAAQLDQAQAMIQLFQDRYNAVHQQGLSLELRAIQAEKRVAILQSKVSELEDLLIKKDETVAEAE